MLIPVDSAAVMAITSTFLRRAAAGSVLLMLLAGCASDSPGGPGEGAIRDFEECPAQSEGPAKLEIVAPEAGETLVEGEPVQICLDLGGAPASAELRITINGQRLSRTVGPVLETTAQRGRRGIFRIEARLDLPRQVPLTDSVELRVVRATP